MQIKFYRSVFGYGTKDLTVGRARALSVRVRNMVSLSVFHFTTLNLFLFCFQELMKSNGELSSTNKNKQK